MPGGFVRYNEDPKSACFRKLKEDAGINVKDIEGNIELFTIRGDPNRDPRRHVVTIVYIVNVEYEVNKKKLINTKSNDFLKLEKVFKTFENSMPFDHYSIIEELVKKKFNNLFK